MNDKYPYAWTFLVPFTVIAAFAVLNLFIGVIVDAVQRTPLSVATDIKKEVAEIEQDVEDIASTQEDQALVQKRILDELRALRAELAASRAGSPPPT